MYYSTTRKPSRYSPSVQCICQQCGASFLTYASNIKRGGGKYCSNECSCLARRKQSDCMCQWCGVRFTTKPSYVKNGQGVYCSVQCRGLAQQKQISCICEYCGKAFITKPSRIKEGGGKHCSKECDVKSREKNKDHWGRGGYRGRNWGTQRKLAYIRDDKRCCVCGKQKQKGLRIDVHHIRPYRLFDGDYLTANQLTNLITLCRKCHKQAELGLIEIQPYLL